MSTNDEILKVVSDTALSINEIYPDTITTEQRTIILNHYLSSDKPLNVIKDELENYKKEIISKISSTTTDKKPYSYENLQAGFKTLKNINKYSKYELYLDSPILPYMVANKKAERRFDSLDILIDLKDIEVFRSEIKNTPYYKEELDSKSFIQDGNDYGLELEMDNLKVRVSPFIKAKDRIIIYKHDNEKYTVEGIKDTKNFFTSFEVEGQTLHGVSYEFLKRRADLRKDVETSKEIDRQGYSYDIYNSIEEPVHIKEADSNNINNASTNEILKNSLIALSYDAKMNDHLDIPKEKLERAIQKLHGKDGKEVESFLDRARSSVVIKVPKSLYNKELENPTPQNKASMGYSNILNMAYTIIIAGVVICLLAIILKII